MIRKHSIIPIHSFFLDCEFNNVASILLSKNSEMIKEIIQNCYRYKVEKRETLSGGNFNRIVLELKYNLLNGRVKEMCPLMYSNSDDFFRKIVTVIDNAMYAFASVDLFDYIPNSICYHRFHWYHFTLIIGYNTEKRTFYVLDDNRNGYQEFEISADSLYQAVLNSNREEPVVYFDFYNIISPTPIHISELRGNAKKIRRDIKNIKKYFFYELNEDDIVIQFDRYLTPIMFDKIRNRHKINRLLFLYLFEEYNLNKKYKNVLIEQAEKLDKHWEELKKQYFKTYLNYATCGMHEVNINISKAFIQEDLMWKIFLQASK